MIYKEKNLITKYASIPLSTKSNQFLIKVNNDTYKFSEYCCPVCGNMEFDYFSYSLKFGYSICKTCGLVQISQRMRREDYNDFYENGEYQDLCMGGLDDISHFYLEYSVMAKYFIDFLNEVKISIKNLSVYEIGCGSGGILLKLKEYGAIVKGSDLDSYRVQFGKKFLNDQISCEDALNLYSNLKPYDLIILSNVLEHVFDPLSFLNKIHNLSELGKTKILIDVPNIDGSIHYSKGNGFLPFTHVGHKF